MTAPKLDEEDEDLLLVRLYLGASAERAELLLRRLQRWTRLRGATLVRGERGFGQHGLALAPTIIEFFEAPSVALEIIAEVHELIEHAVYWPAYNSSRALGQSSQVEPAAEDPTS